LYSRSKNCHLALFSQGEAEPSLMGGCLHPRYQARHLSPPMEVISPTSTVAIYSLTLSLSGMLLCAARANCPLVALVANDNEIVRMGL
jgi:hypothetical protein